MEDFKPLTVVHLKKQRIDLDSVLDITSSFYAKTFNQVRYVVVPGKDYTKLSMQAAQYYPPVRDEGKPLRLKQLYGMYIIPDYNLPQGDVLLLYEDTYL